MSALLLLAAVTSPLPEHRVRLEHAGGSIEAVYRGDVRISLRQVGTAGPGGRPSSLACRWFAELHVRREAAGVAGSTHRTLPPRRVAEGRRAGWCDGTDVAAEREVVAATSRLGGALAEAAAQDRPTLLAELDALFRPA